MTREGPRRPRPRVSEAERRSLYRPTELPPQPWRYTITPLLVMLLTNIAEAAGEMRAAPISYYRRKELEARAKRKRILWVSGDRFVTAKPEEVEAVLGGARLVGHRQAAGEAIQRAAMLEDALAHYTGGMEDRRLTPETAMAYECADQLAAGRTPGRWQAFTMRERAKLLNLHRSSMSAPPAVKALFAWADGDPLVSTNAVLRAGTLFWGLTLLFPQWHAATVVLHHELRVDRVDPYGLLILTEASEAQRELLTTPTTGLMAEADAGDLTSYFERFASALWRVLDERLQELGRVKDNEAYLPWKVVAPPDALDARVYDVVERLGQAGSAAIVEGLGKAAPPLRTVQRRLQKLVRDGVLSKRGARKNALYVLAGREGTGQGA